MRIAKVTDRPSTMSFVRHLFIEKYFAVHVEPTMPLEWSPEYREGGEPATTEAGCGASVEVRGQGVRGRNIG